MRVNVMLTSSSLHPTAYCFDSNSYSSAPTVEMYVIRAVNKAGKYALKYLWSQSVKQAKSLAHSLYPRLSIIEVYRDTNEHFEALTEPQYSFDSDLNKWEELLDEL